MIEKILAAYKAVYGTDFVINEFDNRKQLQKAVFILSLSGMSFDNYYGYIWGEYGPYSSELADDLKLYFPINKKSEYTFEKKENELLQNLKKLINYIKEKSEYGIYDIVEAKASMIFFKNIHLNFSEEDILKKLVKEKPHLANENINKEIFQFSI